MDFTVTQLLPHEMVVQLPRILLLGVSTGLAGLVDAMGGGGGLISAPAMLAAGVPPAFLLGTNKGMAAFGSITGFLRYLRAGLLPKSKHWLAMVLATIFLGGMGALVSTHASFLKHMRLVLPAVILVVMIFVCLGWVRKKSFTKSEGNLTQNLPLVGAVGFYDGLFGPGAGIFFLSIFEKSGFSTLQANACTKVFNLASNVGALFIFAALGKIMWSVSLGCFICYAIGNYVGSGLVLKKGPAMIRITVLMASTGLIIKLLYDYFIT